jgi:uncharacterized protein
MLFQLMLEFVPEKSAANLDKHGIDFETAQLLWFDPYRIESDARSDDEPRTRVAVLIGDKLWSAFVTMRGDTDRIISVRRARESEGMHYAS